MNLIQWNAVNKLLNLLSVAIRLIRSEEKCPCHFQSADKLLLSLTFKILVLPHHDKGMMPDFSVFVIFFFANVSFLFMIEWLIELNLEKRLRISKVLMDRLTYRGVFSWNKSQEISTLYFL